jgi:L-histidine Nalpha-methyltransferase / hercynylcysteine S-oxide synthase
MSGEALIVDVRGKDAARVSNLRHHVISGLAQPSHHRTLPTMLLYDERGLRMYDDITTGASEYYLFGAEEQILKDHAKDIVRSMEADIAGADDQVILELGAGWAPFDSLVCAACSPFASQCPSEDVAHPRCPGRIGIHG